MAIAIGAGAANYPSAGGAETSLDRNGPAGADGIINTFELWHATTGSGVKVGTFYGSGTSYTCRDYESIGSVTAGSKQTFTGLNCDCQTGDIIGWYASSGTLDFEGSWGSVKALYKTGDQFGAGTQTYSETATNRRWAMYGTGVEASGHPTRKRHAGNPFTPFRKGVW